MTVTRLEREIPHRELVEWAEEYQRQPWGTWRDNAHSAMIASVIANAFRGEKSRSFTYEDFMIVDPETAERKKQERRSLNNNLLAQALTAIAKEP